MGSGTTLGLGVGRAQTVRRGTSKQTGLRSPALREPGAPTAARPRRLNAVRHLKKPVNSLKTLNFEPETLNLPDLLQPFERELGAFHRRLAWEIGFLLDGDPLGAAELTACGKHRRPVN